jgi:hypothetical protein
MESHIITIKNEIINLKKLLADVRKLNNLINNTNPSKNYYRLNKDKYKKYYQERKAQRAEYAAEYTQANKKKLNTYAVSYYYKNKDKILENAKIKYRNEHPPKNTTNIQYICDLLNISTN